MTEQQFEELSDAQKWAALKQSGDKVSIMFEDGEEVHTYRCILFGTPVFVFEAKEGNDVPLLAGEILRSKAI